MKTLRVTEQAQRDLEAHYQYSLEVWGEGQASAYMSQLKQRVAQLPSLPHAWPQVPHIRAGYRRMMSQSHAVYYTETDTELVVTAVLHARQDPVAALEQRP